MAIDFIVGDTVDVTLGSTVVRGEVTRIVTEGEEVSLIEVKRPTGSHNEYLRDEEADPGDEFSFVAKVT